MEHIQVALCVRGGLDSAASGLVYDEEQSIAEVQCLTYSFDHVFGPPFEERLYDAAIGPLVERVMSGYNACIFPWGGPGTGKTYTIESLQKTLVGRLFKEIEQKRQTSTVAPHYLVHASVLEICDVDILDLLARKEDQNAPLQMRGDGTNVYLDNITLVETMYPEHLNNVFDLARKRRALHRPHVKERHAIYTVIIESSYAGENGRERFVGRLNFMDILAERKEDGASNVVNEAVIHIVNALVSAQREVPYHSSIMTKLMQDALGGNCATLMLGCVDSSEDDVQTSAATLRFAARVMQVQNTPIRNSTTESKLAQYEDELERLKELYDQQTKRDVDQNWRLDVLRKMAALESRIQGRMRVKPADNVMAHDPRKERGREPDDQGTRSPSVRSSQPDGTVSRVSGDKCEPLSRASTDRTLSQREEVPDKAISSEHGDVDRELPLSAQLEAAQSLLQIRTKQLSEAELKIEEMRIRMNREQQDRIPAALEELINALDNRDPTGQWLAEISPATQAYIATGLRGGHAQLLSRSPLRGHHPILGSSNHPMPTNPYGKGIAAHGLYGLSQAFQQEERHREGERAEAIAPDGSTIPHVGLSPTKGLWASNRRSTSVPRLGGFSRPKIAPPWSIMAPSITPSRPLTPLRDMTLRQSIEAAQASQCANPMAPVTQAAGAPAANNGSDQPRRRSVSPLPRGQVISGPTNLNGRDARWSVGHVNIAALQLTKRDLSPMSREKMGMRLPQRQEVLGSARRSRPIGEKTSPSVPVANPGPVMAGVTGTPEAPNAHPLSFRPPDLNVDHTRTQDLNMAGGVPFVPCFPLSPQKQFIPPFQHLGDVSRGNIGFGACATNGLQHGR